LHRTLKLNLPIGSYFKKEKILKKRKKEKKKKRKKEKKKKGIEQPGSSRLGGIALKEKRCCCRVLFGHQF